MMGISLLAKSATFSRPRSPSLELGYEEGCVTIHGYQTHYHPRPRKPGKSLSEIIQNEP